VAVRKVRLAIWMKAKPETLVSNQKKLSLKHAQNKREESDCGDTNDTRECLSSFIDKELQMGNIYDNQGEINRIWYRKCVVKNKELKN
jgi:hypothetical protein